MATAQPPIQQPRIPRDRALLIAAAAVAGLLVLAGAAGYALRPAAAPSSAPGLTVLPPANTAGTTGGGAQTSDAGAPLAAGASYKPMPQAAAAAAPYGTAASYPVPVGYCQQTPAVQLSGRVLGVTAMAPVAAGPDTVRTLSVTVQNQAASATDAMSGLSDRLGNIEKALNGAGATSVSRNGVNVWGGQPYNNGQYTASAQITASVATSALGPAGDAIAKLPGVTGYSAYQAAPSPSSDAVGKAIATASASAAAMAKSAAEAAGVSLGAIQQVSAQPPIACGWNAGGPQEVVQVTLTYALK